MCEGIGATAAAAAATMTVVAAAEALTKIFVPIISRFIPYVVVASFISSIIVISRLFVFLSFSAQLSFHRLGVYCGRYISDCNIC
jgi:hypothetical protein